MTEPQNDTPIKLESVATPPQPLVAHNTLLTDDISTDAVATDMTMLDRDILPERRESLQLQTNFRHRSTSIQLAREDYNREQGTSSNVQVTMPNFDSMPTPNIVDEKDIPKHNAEIRKELLVDYHSIKMSELLDRYNTTAESGYIEEHAKILLAKHGLNSIKEGNRFKLLLNIIEWLFGGFGIILWPAALLCLLSYQPLGAPNPSPMNLGVFVILLVVIFLSAGFHAFQDRKSSRVMNSISKMLPTEAHVIRDGVEKTITVNTIVPGDIVVCRIGNRVPADLRIIENHSIKVDNSILTGESEPIAGTTECTDENYMESKNLMFMGTSVIEGSCTAIVVATGNETVMGKISKMAHQGSTSTPIKKEINLFMLLIICLALSTALTLILTWVFWLRVSYPGFLSLSNMLINVIGAIVAFLPDGLPIAVTLTFSVMAKRMYDHNVLIKVLPTVETLGSVDIIASDKTGTLTQNRMSVMHIVSGLRKLEHGDQCRKLFEQADPAVSALLRGLGLCNRAFFESSTENIPINLRKVNGDASDSGILQFVEDFFGVQEARDHATLLGEIPFNSKNKWMMSIWTDAHNSDTATLYMKGAAEIIADKCKFILMPDGSKQEMTEEIRKQLAEQQEEMAANGERVLGCLQSTISPKEYDFEHVSIEKMQFPDTNNTFLGLVSLIDPPREDVMAAISQLRLAGIRVMMVTGDHPETARAIARMVGIVTAEDRIEILNNDSLNEENMADKEAIAHRALVIKGVVIPELNEKSWDYILEHTEIVFARTTPDHKLRIVKECQKRKHIVAMTGDGVNDAPSLKQANVGVAMGSGSDVAREAADLVLTDSKFSSIVDGVKNGRLVFDNMKKVILYLLPAGSFSELMPIMANTFLGLPLPLSAFLMLVICCCTDIFPSLALIYEEAEADLMAREPRSRTGERLVNPQLIFHAYFITGLFESFAAFTMYFYYFYVYAGLGFGDLFLCFNNYQDGYKGKSQAELDNHLFTAQTIFFVTLAIVQWGNLLATRTRRLSFFQHNPLLKKTQNKYLIPAILASCAIAVWVVYLPVFNDVFQTAPIPIQFWFIPLGWALLYFTIDELRKLLLRQFPWQYARYVFW
jgi:sodium/potassium-transporting ATPase subunit alpha